MVESHNNIATGIESYYGFSGITFDSISLATSGPSCVFAICPEIVDNIQISTATTPVPFEFDPTVGLVSLGIWFGAWKLRKKYLAKKLTKD